MQTPSPADLRSQLAATTERMQALEALDRWTQAEADEYVRQSFRLQRLYCAVTKAEAA